MKGKALPDVIKAVDIYQPSQAPQPLDWLQRGQSIEHAQAQVLGRQ
jgi:hypothetical protein